MKKTIIIAVIFILFSGFFAFAQTEDAENTESDFTYIKWICAAFSVGLSCIAGGIAVGQIGAAAMAAMSENPELAGKALPYVGLAEGICLWGFIVALMLIIF
jgi:V/A-type H+/Na+-transporting ATPase subunit K